ncbi:MAG: hypothetical protein ACKO1J_17775 [Tagaea sp.]
MERYLPSSIAAHEAAWERTEVRVSCAVIRKWSLKPQPEKRLAMMPAHAYALMIGYCGQRDIAGAHALFREAIARGAGDYVFVAYYSASDEAGEEEARKELLIPAAAVVAADESYSPGAKRLGRIPPPQGAEFTALSQRMMEAVRGSDPALTLEIVRLLGTREFATRSAERDVLLRSVLTLRRVLPFEGPYWDAHLQRTGRIRTTGPDIIFLSYTQSARCAHTAAIRERAQFWLDGHVEVTEASRAHIVATVARLHERTGEDQALLDAVVAKSGLPPERALSGGFFRSFDIEDPSLCRR